MPSKLLLNCVIVKGIKQCFHISIQSSDRIWVSDEQNLVFKNSTGLTLHHIMDIYSETPSGLHTVNTDHELIYIDKNYSIKKLSKDMKTTTTFIRTIESAWRPLCVYYSTFAKHLLVGMSKDDPRTGKVMRYDHKGQLLQTTQYNDKKCNMYRKPNFITENNNGDIIVSDMVCCAVVVTDSHGKYRFSYPGNSKNLLLSFQGICTDSQSNILICEENNDFILIIDKNGRFLSSLPVHPPWKPQPYSLSYNAKHSLLLVGLGIKNMINVYRYSFPQDVATSKSYHQLSKYIFEARMKMLYVFL